MPRGSDDRLIIALRSHEALHQIVCPSVLPCLGTLVYYLRRVAAQLLMDPSMTDETQTFQSWQSAVDSQPSHLIFGSGCFNRHDVMYAAGRCYNALLHTLFTQSLGAPELSNAQLLPLAAVVYLCLVLSYLSTYTSPISSIAHVSTPNGLPPSARSICSASLKDMRCCRSYISTDL